MRITAVVDNHGWCWTTTARDLSHAMPEHEFKFVPASQYHPSEGEELVWCRGYAQSIAKRHQPQCPWVWTMATGGQRLERRLSENRGSEFVICQCRLAYDAMTERGYKAWLIPNGVNCVMFHPATPGLKQRRRVGFAGNITGERNELKGVACASNGCGKAGVSFVTTTSTEPLSHAKMADWYRTLWAYAQPSESEGCSNSVMEAMSSGLPVLICEGVGYHGEFCRDGIVHHDGEVVFVRRDAGDIAEKISILMQNPYLYRRVSANARAFAERHAWKHIARKMEEVFLEVTGNARIDKPRLTPAAEKAKTPALAEVRVPLSMVYVAQKPMSVFGRNYSPGELVHDLPDELALDLIKSRHVMRRD